MDHDEAAGTPTLDLAAWQMRSFLHVWKARLSLELHWRLRKISDTLSSTSEGREVLDMALGVARHDQISQMCHMGKGVVMISVGDYLCIFFQNYPRRHGIGR